MLLKNQRLSFNAGFTLMEMLVIVAVIAVLTAIGWPIFAHQREQRRRTLCCSNLTYAIGLSIIQYAEDYDEFFPLIATGRFVPGRSMSWRRAIMPYAKDLKDLDGFRCPSNPASAYNSAIDGLPLSYDVADSGPIRRNKPLKLNQIPISAQTILVFEENVTNPQTQQVGVSWDKTAQAAGDVNVLYAGHGGMAYYLFADGHAKLLRPLDTIANGINMWHLNNQDPVTPGAMRKLQAATHNFR